MSLYAWNSTPVPGTDISCGIIVTGREFHFHIDFSGRKHTSLTSSPTKANQFAADQAHLISACRLISKEMILHHRPMHRELINAHGNPRISEVGDRISPDARYTRIRREGLLQRSTTLIWNPGKLSEKNLTVRIRCSILLPSMLASTIPLISPHSQFNCCRLN